MDFSIIKEDIITLAMALGCLGVLMILNIIVGAVVAEVQGDWSWKKFLWGIAKALMVALTMIVFCAVLDVQPIIWARAGIEIPEDMVTVVQLFSITLVAVTKYTKDLLEKYKTYLA